MKMSSQKRPVRRRFSQDFSGESKTQQHFTESCDVNTIVAHFRQTGVDPYQERADNQQFGFASSVDFSEAMQNIAEIRSKFEELPAEDRSGFGNDPAQWLDSLTTPPPDPDPETPPEPSQEPSPDPVPEPSITVENDPK